MPKINSVPSVLFHQIHQYLTRYISMEHTSLNMVSAWVLAASQYDLWDRFPHLGVTSPEPRCGKTRLLELLSYICPEAWFLTGVTAATVYRTILKADTDGKRRPCLLLDESQSLNNRKLESSSLLSEIFCGGISRNSAVCRCTGQHHTPVNFPVYCPKVIAMSEEIGGALGDRCLPVRMKRRTREEQQRQVPARLRVIEQEASVIKQHINEWSGSDQIRKQLRGIYDTSGLLDIGNERIAELLLPLQACLSQQFPNTSTVFKEYVTFLRSRDQEQDLGSTGIQLLAACREIYSRGQVDFLCTVDLLSRLSSRPNEPWNQYPPQAPNGKPITDVALSKLLRPYGVRPVRKSNSGPHGYYKVHFADAWNRYLPDLSK